MSALNPELLNLRTKIDNIPEFGTTTTEAKFQRVENFKKLEWYKIGKTQNEQLETWLDNKQLPEGITHPNELINSIARRMYVNTKVYREGFGVNAVLQTDFGLKDILVGQELPHPRSLQRALLRGLGLPEGFTHTSLLLSLPPSYAVFEKIKQQYISNKVNFQPVICLPEFHQDGSNKFINLATISEEEYSFLLEYLNKTPKDSSLEEKFKAHDFQVKLVRNLVNKHRDMIAPDDERFMYTPFKAVESTHDELDGLGAVMFTASDELAQQMDGLDLADKQSFYTRAKEQGMGDDIVQYIEMDFSEGGNGVGGFYELIKERISQSPLKKVFIKPSSGAGGFVGGSIDKNKITEIDTSDNPINAFRSLLESINFNINNLGTILIEDFYESMTDEITEDELHTGCNAVWANGQFYVNTAGVAFSSPVFIETDTGEIIEQPQYSADAITNERDPELIRTIVKKARDLVVGLDMPDDITIICSTDFFILEDEGGYSVYHHDFNMGRVTGTGASGNIASLDMYPHGAYCAHVDIQRPSGMSQADFADKFGALINEGILMYMTDNLYATDESGEFEAQVAIDPKHIEEIMRIKQVRNLNLRQAMSIFINNRLKAVV